MIVVGMYFWDFISSGRVLVITCVEHLWHCSCCANLELCVSFVTHCLYY
jgi:hypothetical protein